MGDVSWICEALFEYHLLSKTTYIHTYNTYPKILFEKKSQTKIHKLEIILEINVCRWVIYWLMIPGNIKSIKNYEMNIPGNNLRVRNKKKVLGGWVPLGLNTIPWINTRVYLLVLGLVSTYIRFGGSRIVLSLFLHPTHLFWRYGARMDIIYRGIYIPYTVYRVPHNVPTTISIRYAHSRYYILLLTPPTHIRYVRESLY